MNTFTSDFIWKNGILHQKVLHEDPLTGFQEAEPEWIPVKVGDRLVADPKFKTFEQRNGKAPADCLPQNNANDQYNRHVIEFDGGTSCNNPKRFGKGYGSYQIDGGQIVRVEFGSGHSNNSAEIRTLVAGLTALADQPCDKPRIVMARGDSKIALKWVKCKNDPSPNTSEGFREAIELLRQQVSRFHNVKTEWRRRTHSVELFGH